jgi:hypothetical protein
MPPMRTHLIVANQTLLGDALRSEVVRRLEAGPARFHVVVPATPVVGRFTWDEETAFAAARDRLDAGIQWLISLGAEADGEVGDRDPVQAVRDAIRRTAADEIVLSTLPAGLSRWLGQDVPSRLRDAVSVPLTVVTEGRRSAVADAAVRG